MSHKDLNDRGLNHKGTKITKITKTKQIFLVSFVVIVPLWLSSPATELLIASVIGR